jgi:hypothetical protein
MKAEDLKLIHKFVDDGLKKLAELDLMKSPGNVPFEMIDKSVKKDDDWTPWKPIESTVTDQEITQLEALTNCTFPESFISFLKYKHFYELFLPDPMLVGFYKHPVRKWLEEYTEMYSYDWVHEDLIANRIIPFANYYDYGFLCFDAREAYDNNEYPILMVDHEEVGNMESYSVFSVNFMDMVRKKLIYEDL